MKFILDNSLSLCILDIELSDLLTQVYVHGGFTTTEVAATVFNPVSVKERGMLYAAREITSNEFCGMVILVPPGSSAIVRAKENECEMHLLGVKVKFRGNGLGRKLVAKAIKTAEQNNWSKIILWTQKSMIEAQKLYESFGFIQTDVMSKNGLDFLIYERENT